MSQYIFHVRGFDMLDDSLAFRLRPNRRHVCTKFASKYDAPSGNIARVLLRMKGKYVCPLHVLGCKACVQDKKKMKKKST